MGLVKFNNTTLNIDGVPDGHVIIPETKFSELNSVSNSYSLLKSYIPVGVPESQLGILLEKGQKYDPLAQELTTHKTSVADLTGKLGKFQNIPQEFTVEQWNKDRTKEKQDIISQKKNNVNKAAFEKIEKDLKIKPIIDERFLPPEAATFDFDHKDAVDNWIKVLNSADDAQQAFMKNLQTGIPQSQPIGIPSSTIIDGKRTMDTRPADSVTERGVELRKL